MLTTIYKVGVYFLSNFTIKVTGPHGRQVFAQGHTARMWEMEETYRGSLTPEPMLFLLTLILLPPLFMI